ncbi:hypothetical protein K5X70_004840 [Escherichia coli]|uniref:hypothetical protein n=1 Tax=Escherichia coli TaxID=562 RepID=UPI0017FD58BC|nr:hypothetical protein [Escherichia coli]EFH6216377.1 hypothetical protein [Escherichia coli]EHZ4695407.1 hypothetical protein [Escherichia coli]EIX1892148.1 hypothetical protein [Escherichia coli]HDP4878976.1 hypothetical protein [Escherichia coli]HDP4888104.1 hypothetical protein [Escherichia coli]
MSCPEPMTDQSDLFRLTYVIEKLKSQGWQNAVVFDSEWGSDIQLSEYLQTAALLVRKAELEGSF